MPPARGPIGALSFRAMISASTADLIAKLTKCERRLLANVRVGVLEGRDERRDRARVANLTECKRRLLANVGLLIAQGLHQAVDSRRIAKLAQGKHGLLAHAVVGVAERAGEGRRRAAIANLAERERCLLTNGGVLVLEGGNQPAAPSSGHEAGRVQTQTVRGRWRWHP